MQHDWATEQQYSLCIKYRCNRCAKIKFVEWTPGWPPYNTYYSLDGDKVRGNYDVDVPCAKEDKDGILGYDY